VYLYFQRHCVYTHATHYYRRNNRVICLINFSARINIRASKKVKNYFLALTAYSYYLLTLPAPYNIVMCVHGNCNSIILTKLLAFSGECAISHVYTLRRLSYFKQNEMVCVCVFSRGLARTRVLEREREEVSEKGSGFLVNLLYTYLLTKRLIHVLKLNNCGG